MMDEKKGNEKKQKLLGTGEAAGTAGGKESGKRCIGTAFSMRGPTH